MTIQRIIPDSSTLADISHAGCEIIPFISLNDDGGVPGFPIDTVPLPIIGVNTLRVSAGLDGVNSILLVGFGSSLLPGGILIHDNLADISPPVVDIDGDITQTLPWLDQAGILLLREDGTIVQILPWLDQELIGDIPVTAAIEQILPFLDQRLVVGSTAYISLPDAAYLHTGGRRWKYRFYSANTLGMVIQAWPGNIIRIGAVEGTTVSCETPGCFLELFALDDIHVACSVEQPPGSWTLT